MKYFVLESAIADGAQANAVTVKENYNDARMLWHQIRASQFANGAVTYGIACILDETGRLYESEYHGFAAIPTEPVEP